MKLKKQNEAIEDRIIRDLRTLLSKKNVMNQLGLLIFKATVIMNVKVMSIEINFYELKTLAKELGLSNSRYQIGLEK